MVVVLPRARDGLPAVQAALDADTLGHPRGGDHDRDGGTTSEPASTEFRADHPFLFAIVDRVTGSVLFLGKVEDPSP
jgi:hypothetical protein